MAATIAHQYTTVTSNKRIVTAKLTSTTTADTFVTGLGYVEFFTITPATTGLSGIYATESSGTITLTYTGGSGAETFYIMAMGS